jgi:hypothetical protein
MYHREAKTVLIGEGKFFKYEFDCSKARIPALAAVSPNLETGPAVKFIPYDRSLRSEESTYLGQVQRQFLDNIAEILRFGRVSESQW